MSNTQITNESATPVRVTVTDDSTIVCTPSCKHVQMGSGDVHVAWVLATDGYEFPTTDAVVIKSLPNSNFPDAVKYISPTSVSLKDCCHTAETFSYTVSVVNTVTKKVISLDPEIKNNNTTDF